MQRSLAQLKEELRTRGIDPDSLSPSEGSKKVGSKEYIRALQTYEIEKRGGCDSLSWGMKQRLLMESPMLCFPYKDLKPGEQKACMTEDFWIAERKLDGVRMIVTYCPSEGFGFFSRNLSVADFLPVEYTDKVLLRGPSGHLHSSRYFTEDLDYCFVLDVELLCDEPRIDTTVYLGKGGTITETKLNAVTTILSIDAEISRLIQREQAPLRPVVFDVLRHGKQSFGFNWNFPLNSTPLYERMRVREQAIKELQDFGLSIEEVDWTIEGKEEFFQTILAEGGEGIVLKNMNSPYIATSSRSREGFVKRKRTLAEALGRDIDAFISGFVPAKPDKKWGHLIGAVEMSVILQYPDGTERDCTIAAVSGIPQELREKMTAYDSEGKPCLNSEYLNQVLSIDGQDISPKSKRFMHATADWERGFRPDKSYFECTLDAEWVDSQIL